MATTATRTHAAQSDAAANGTHGAGYVPSGSQQAAPVNPAFAARPARRKDARKTEPREQLAMIRRMVRAAGRRIVLEDPSELAQLVALRAELDATIARTAKALHETPDANGHTFSWTAIGEAEGISRQAAYQKYGQGR